MNKQNQEYFNAKKSHEKNVSPKAWLTVIPILVILLGVMAWVTTKSSQISADKADHEMLDIGTRIIESNKTEKETIVRLGNLGLTVKLHEGLHYDYSTPANMMTAISQDSNELAYLIGEVPINMQKSNMKELWINSVNEIDPNQTFRDSLGQTIVETTQNGKHYKGILNFKELNGKKLFFQSICLKNRFKALEPQMNKVLKSIKEE